ncbi:acyltransferase family protein [Ferruginibacter sp.]
MDKGEFAGFNYAYWSLGHELIFYLLFPLYNKLNKYAAIALAVIFAVLFIVTKNEIFYYQVFFLAGLLLYDYFFNHSTGAVIKNKIFYAIILAGLFVAVNLSNKMISEKCSDMVTLVAAFFIFDYVLHYVRQKNKWLMKLGDISYSLYLNHLSILLLVYTLLTLYTGKLVFYSRLPYYSGVLIAVLVTIPLYSIMEKPSIKYLKKLRK